MFYDSETFPGETHFYVALLEDGTHLTFGENYFEEERLPWCPIPSA